jgi:hypothetical protein
MATRLYPRHGSQNVDRNSIKIKIDCKNRIVSNPETKDWLELLSKFKHDASNIKVYKALLDKNKNIVAKIGKYKLDYEYEVAKNLEILKMPTFIKFHCLFSCLDNFSELKNNTKTVCKKEGEPVSIILMPYIEEERIELWKWERNNFELMKNVMKHVFLSLFYAKQKIGFIHGDLHLGNVLLKKSNRKEITYGDYGSLQVLGLMPVIMDFDKSNFLEKFDTVLYEDLKRFMLLMSDSCNVKFDNTLINNLLIKKIISTDEQDNIILSNTLCKYIDNLQITYVSSELPQIPNWLKPQKV